MALNANNVEVKATKKHACIYKPPAGPDVDICWLYLWRVPSCINCTSASMVSPCHWFDVQLSMLTHWGRDNMATIFQTTFSYAFSWMKMNDIRLKFHWSLYLRFQLPIFQHWFRWWLAADQATSYYLNQWWLFYQRIYVSLGLNEALWSIYALAN